MKEVDELRQQSKEELEKMLKQEREKLLRLKIEKELGKLKDTSQIKKTKKRIARILTILREREIKNSKDLAKR